MLEGLRMAPRKPVQLSLLEEPRMQFDYVFPCTEGKGKTQVRCTPGEYEKQLRRRRMAHSEQCACHAPTGVSAEEWAKLWAGD